MAVNPKGYVPMLVLDHGETVTENIAVLSWITSQTPALTPPGPLGHIRQLEALAFISTEVHHGFKPFFHGARATRDIEMAIKFGILIPAPIIQYFQRVMKRDSVRKALAEEGLS